MQSSGGDHGREAALSATASPVCLNQGQVTVTLEIEADSDPIAGRVRVEGERPREFTGWVELAAAIEGAVAASRAPDSR